MYSAFTGFEVMGISFALAAVGWVTGWPYPLQADEEVFAGQRCRRHGGHRFAGQPSRAESCAPVITP